MSERIEKNNTSRIIDANINRAKEGLRVCEEVARFILESPGLTKTCKELRHKISSAQKGNFEPSFLLKERNSRGDIGKNIFIGELKRKNIADIFTANIQRVKESFRVLEEFSKLKDIRLAVKFKNLRYESYEVERKFYNKIVKLRKE